MGVPEPPRSDTSRVLPAFTPHRAINLEGALCCGRPTARRREQVAGLILEALTDLVSQVVEWSVGSADADRHLGDSRFLVLSLRTISGTDAYVQIWSAPYEALVMEVGPGNRRDALRQAFADGIRAPLLDRGFAIGGDADNFEKALPIRSGDDAARIAREILAILLDVLKYDGRGDLAYRFHQATILEDGHLLTGIGRSTLCKLMQRWGLQATLSKEDSALIKATSWELRLQLQLAAPKPERKSHFQEIHCFANFTLPASDAKALVEKVNNRPYLMKAHFTMVPGEPVQKVRLSVGINLAGGVSLDHVRAQIVKFLYVVRKLLP